MTLQDRIRDRIIVDGNDREEWLTTRRRHICASDTAKFAKLSSVETYIRQKLTIASYSSSLMQSGHRWEPMVLAFLGASKSTALYRHPEHSGFAATPDGFDRDGLGLVEIKTRHNLVDSGPTLQELRQLAWQLFVIPEAEYVDFCWAEIINQSGDWELRRDPQVIRFDKDSKPIQEMQELIIPIALQVMRGLEKALELEKEMA